MKDPNKDAEEIAKRKARQDDPEPGKPKRAHRDYVDGGKNLNKDTREELRNKH